MANPLKALTLTPCWAHAVMHLGKKVENRNWTPSYRWPLLIHVGKNFKVHEFERICAFAAEDGKRTPQREDILIGGVVGVVDFYKLIEDGDPGSDDPWFGGPRLGVPQNSSHAVSADERPARVVQCLSTSQLAQNGRHLIAVVNSSATERPVEFAY